MRLWRNDDVDVLTVRPWEPGSLSSRSESVTVTEEQDDLLDTIARLQDELAQAQSALAQARENHRSDVEGLKASHTEELARFQAQFSADARAAIEALTQAEREVRGLANVWTENVRANVIALATAAARRIVGALVEDHPEIVQQSVDVALAKLGNVDDQVIARLNPADLEHLRDSADASPHIRWIADERVRRGGCVIEAGERLIDGDIDRALAALYRDAING